MTIYENGKIYKIEPINGGDVGDVYAHHKYEYKKWKEGNKNYTSSYILFDKYGLDKCQVVFVENVENCKSKDELLAKEKFYIKNNECVNLRIPLRTYKEYYNENIQNILLYHTEYYKNNADEIKEYQKKYRDLNDTKVKAFKNAQFICECGMQYTHSNKSRHCKTKRHQAFLCHINV